MTRTVAVLTTSRADFSHLIWPLRRIAQHPALEPELIVTGAHLSDEFGHSIDEIRAAGFEPDHVVECLLSSDTDVGMAKTIGIATLSLADLLARRRPDILLLTADRYEMLGPAAAALALRIPVAHIEGGEISEGAIDDAVRNALTKLAHLHFTPTENARRRVIAMGEEAWRVHTVGAPSIDILVNEQLLTVPELEQRLDCRLPSPPCLIAVHPVTLLDDTLAEIDAIIAALGHTVAPIAFCFPNADAGSRELIRRARAFCEQRDDARVFVNLAPQVYWSLLACSALLVGNSSSGIMETPSLAVPTVNIGLRQQGRERARNIIDVPARADAILDGMRRAQSEQFRESLGGMNSPYGDGCAGDRIAQLLADAPPRPVLLHKRGLPLLQTGPDRYAFGQEPSDSR